MAGSSARRPYKGVFPVVPTVFDGDGRLDLDGQKRAVDCMIDAGSHGLCILANFSEQFVLTDSERELALAPAAQLGLQRIGDGRPVRGQQPGVHEPDDVIALALGQQHPVHASPGPVVADIAFAHPGPGQVHREHDHSPGRSAQFADLGREPSGGPESAWQDVCYSHSQHYCRPVGR